jgi:hypothetical protein
MRPHGTAGRYNNGKCRCRPCTDAWALYIYNHEHAKPERLERRALQARANRLKSGATRKTTNQPYRSRS